MTQTEQIQQLKKEKNAVILAHTYQPGEIQDCADFVGDSYGLSVEATRCNADIIIFCGVMFMAETAAILNPSKKVIIPEPDAGCPMADMILPEDLIELKKDHPDYLVICYVNSTAQIKALSDICCTSSNALGIVKTLPAEKGIIFIPDRHLGTYVQDLTGKKMILWDGFCPTHSNIRPEIVKKARMEHPDALVLMHPEVPLESRALADRILSTGGMCSFVKSYPHKEFIIATETGIIHTLQKQNPEKRFYPVSDMIVCPNMKRNSLDLVIKSLDGSAGKVVTVDRETADRAYGALKKMLDMGA
jgi:quinolinate synthase